MEQTKNTDSDESVGNAKLISDAERKYRMYGGAAILGISGISAIIAGLVTSHVAKKKNQELLKELGKEALPQVLESPYSLAFRALAWGTVWAVGGCSLIAFGIWKWCGFKDMNDLRTRLRSHIKKGPSNEAEDFESFTDFLNYLSEESRPKKAKKT